jgi:predicted Zn finger-like uncharacterized protein
MPAMQIKCPSCATILQVPPSVSPGGTVRCPKCQTVLRVPGQAPAPPAPPSKPAPPPAPPRPAASPLPSYLLPDPPPRPVPAPPKPAASPLPSYLQETPQPQPPRPRSAPPRNSGAIKPAPKAPAPRPPVRKEAVAEEPPVAKRKSHKGLILGCLATAMVGFLSCSGLVAFVGYKFYTAGKEFVEQVKESAATLAVPEKKGLDIAFIHAECNGATVLYPARILKSSSALVPKGKDQEDMLSDVIKATYIDPREVEQIILVTEPATKASQPAPSGDQRKPPPGWQNYTFAQGGFSISAPGTPVPINRADSRGNHALVYQVNTKNPAINYRVEVISPPPGAPRIPQQTALASVVVGLGPGLKSKKPIQQNGLQGLEVEVETKKDAGPMTTNARVFVSGTRRYLVAVSAPQGSERPNDAKAFLDSFQLLSPARPKLASRRVYPAGTSPAARFGYAGISNRGRPAGFARPGWRHPPLQ